MIRSPVSTNQRQPCSNCRSRPKEQGWRWEKYPSIWEEFSTKRNIEWSISTLSPSATTKQQRPDSQSTSSLWEDPSTSLTKKKGKRWRAWTSARFKCTLTMFQEEEPQLLKNDWLKNLTPSFRNVWLNTNRSPKITDWHKPKSSKNFTNRSDTKMNRSANWQSISIVKINNFQLAISN